MIIRWISAGTFRLQYRRFPCHFRAELHRCKSCMSMSVVEDESILRSAGAGSGKVQRIELEGKCKVIISSFELI